MGQGSTSYKEAPNAKVSLQKSISRDNLNFEEKNGRLHKLVIGHIEGSLSYITPIF